MATYILAAILDLAAILNTFRQFSVLLLGTIGSDIQKNPYIQRFTFYV